MVSDPFGVDVWVAFFVLFNVYADLQIWYEVRKMRKIHETIEKGTKTIEDALLAIQGKLGPNLESTAKYIVEGIAGALSFVEERSTTTSKKLSETMNASIEGLGPVLGIIKGLSNGEGPGGESKGFLK